jgi:hypothetical protein
MRRLNDFQRKSSTSCHFARRPQERRLAYNRGARIHKKGSFSEQVRDGSSSLLAALQTKDAEPPSVRCDRNVIERWRVSILALPRQRYIRFLEPCYNKAAEKTQ